MENKHVGYLILSIAAVIVFIIFLFNSAMKEIVATSCGPVHGLVCPMNQTIENQTWLSLGIAALVIAIAIFLIFTKPNERIVIRKVQEKGKKKEYDLSELKTEEKEVFRLVQEHGAAFQSDLIDKTKYGKAKMTRIIDRLEGRGLVERKRRGMTNVVVMKE